MGDYHVMIYKLWKCENAEFSDNTEYPIESANKKILSDKCWTNNGTKVRVC